MTERQVTYVFDNYHIWLYLCAIFTVLAQRSYVFDDQADYFESSTSIWLDETEQEEARNRDEKRREKQSGRHKEVVQ